MVNVFGSGPKGLQPFTDKGFDGDDFRLVEHVGKAAIFKVHGPKEITTNRYGVKTAIQADVVVLDADGEGKEFSNVLIFNAAPVDQLKGLTGQEVVAQIEEYESNAGGKAPRLAEPSQASIAAAEKFQAAKA